jgi:hypothetical protein
LRVSREEIVERAIGHFTKADPRFGERLTAAVNEARITRGASRR